MLSFGTRSLTLFPCLMSLTEYFKVFHKGPFIYYVIHLYMFPFDIFSKTDILSFFSDTNILLSYLIYSILIFNLRDWPTWGSSPSTSWTPSSSPTGSSPRGSRCFFQHFTLQSTQLYVMFYEWPKSLIFTQNVWRCWRPSRLFSSIPSLRSAPPVHAGNLKPQFLSS